MSLDIINNHFWLFTRNGVLIGGGCKGSMHPLLWKKGCGAPSFFSHPSFFCISVFLPPPLMKKGALVYTIVYTSAGKKKKKISSNRTWPWPIGAGCEICTAIQAQQLSKQSIWVKWLGEILWLRLMTARLYADGPTCHVLFPYYSHCKVLDFF